MALNLRLDSAKVIRELMALNLCLDSAKVISS